MTRGFRPPADEQRCTATTRKGTRCPKFRVKGTTVCLAHGAKAPQVRAAADRRVAEAQAAEIAGRLDVEVPQFASAADAVRYVVERMSRRAAQFGALADQLDGLTYTDRAGTERLRAAVAGERQQLDSLTKVLAVVAQAESARQGDAVSAAEVDDLLDAVVRAFEAAVADALCDDALSGQVCNLANFGTSWDELKMTRGEEPGVILVGDPSRARLPMRLLDTEVADRIREAMTAAFRVRLKAELEWRERRRQQGHVVRGRVEPSARRSGSERP